MNGRLQQRSDDVGFRVAPAGIVCAGLTRMLPGVVLATLPSLHAASDSAPVHPSFFIPEGVFGYLTAALILGLAFAIRAILRQRDLRHRIARQAADLAESRAQLTDAQQFARIGHWQRILHPREGPLEWSDETFRIFERDPALGAPASLDELLNLATGPDRVTWELLVRRARDEGVAFELDIAIEPRPGVRKVVHLLGRPTRDKAGRVTGLFGTVQDITPWREAEQALRQSERLLRALYDNLPYSLGVFEVAEEQCLVVSVNPAAVHLLELSAPPAPGRPLAELGLAPERFRYWTDLVACCRASGGPINAELVRETPRREFAVTIVPLGAAPAERPQFCFLAEDVTARRQKDAEIAQGRRLRAIGELVGGIAHEFNNLLTPVLLKSDLLMTEWSHEPGLCDELKVIAGTARRSADLTRRLLTFGRRGEVRPELVSLGDAIESNFNLLRLTIDRRIALESELPDSLPALWLNVGDVRQVFLNLLLNARDTLVEKLAGQRDGTWSPRISVTALAVPTAAATPIDPAKPLPPNHWVRVTCEDNGMGMASDVIERVFEPFYTTKQVGHGTGLGLATVWHLVAEMGGRVDIESVPDVGTAFHVYLPVHPPPAMPPERATGATPAPPFPPAPLTGERAHLLVVEDDGPVAALIGQILKRLGYAVTWANDGSDGWARLTASPTAYHALILDLNMPGLTGAELLQRARDLPYERPVIIVSGRITDDERKELLRLRVNALVQKPFTVETFTAALAVAGLRPRRVN